MKSKTRADNEEDSEEVVLLFNNKQDTPPGTQIFMGEGDSTEIVETTTVKTTQHPNRNIRRRHEQELAKARVKRFEFTKPLVWR
jgi:hypothetical protein